MKQIGGVIKDEDFKEYISQNVNSTERIISTVLYGSKGSNNAQCLLITNKKITILKKRGNGIIIWV